MVTWPTTYRDAHGAIATTIENDGKTLRMSLDGVVFEGIDFDGFEVASAASPEQLSRFRFMHGFLRECTFEVQIPVTVMAGARAVAALLDAQLRLGPAPKDGGFDDENLRLVLVAGDVRVESEGRTGWFEDELADVQRKLPDGWFLKMCFGCGLSDYSPAGHGLFGGLACFRDNKIAYRAVNTKDELFRVWDTMTDFVQETYLCPEFERRTPGSGYRG